MSRKVLLTGLGLIFLLALLTGCSKLPQQELDAAKASLDAARQAQADRYVPEEFRVAKDSLDAATAEVERQNSKFALFRSYGNAKNMLVAAKAVADATVESANRKKEEVKAECTQLMTDAATAVQAVKDLIAKAPRGKEGKQALEMISADLAQVESSLTEAQNVFNGGDFLTARDRLKAAIAKANGLATELNDAIAKKTFKKEM